MSLSELQAAVQDAQAAYQAKEQEISGYHDEKYTQTIRLKNLDSQVAAKKKALKSALTQSSAETLTTEFNALKEQHQACGTLVSNIESYLKNQANNEKIEASQAVDKAKMALMKFVYEDIKSQLDVMSPEQKELMKDFVVISKIITPTLDPGSVRSSYHLGLIFDVLYGELKGPEFNTHSSQMMAKYLTPSI
ncbi:MAG: hypothetical protein ACTH5B_05455 [Marinomonas sp.]|uniref:hypothetical protein n=1 Tax=Marinomonas sp. TaxID=1904862 RepID=UPI003F9D0844